MNSFTFVVFILLKLILQINGLDYDDPYISTQEKLISDLLIDYDKTLRPSFLVTGQLVIQLRNILEMNEKDIYMKISCFFSETWVDSRLKWNASMYNNLTYIKVQAKKLWIPDLFVTNADQTNGFLAIHDDYLATVTNKGKIFLLLSEKSLQTRCIFNVKKFPFDEQKCYVNLGSWSYSKKHVRFETKAKDIDLSTYTENSLWNLLNVSVFQLNNKNRMANDFILESTDKDEYLTNDISFEFHTKRRPLYFMINSIFPMFVLNLITLAIHFIDFSYQVGLCMTIILTFSINSISILQQFPVQSEYMPTISFYFIFSIFFTLVSLLWFIFINYFSEKKYLPGFLLKAVGLMNKLISKVNFAKKKQVTLNKYKVNEDESSQNSAESNQKSKVKDEKKEEEEKLFKEAIFVLKIIAFFVLFLSMLISFLVIWLEIAA